MKIPILTYILALFFTTSLSAQTQVRYTQKAEEIDLVKLGEAAYNSGNWDELVSHYHADAIVDHNGVTLSPQQLVTGLQTNSAQCSYYSLNLLTSELERIINDRGEVWVNSWGSWQGILKGTTDTVTMPIHIAYEFKDGKISREFAMYNNTILDQALAAASIGNDQLLLIREDHVNPGSEAAYPKMVAGYVKTLDESKVAGLNWTSAMSEDKSMAIHQTEINSLLDVQAKRDEERLGHMAVGNDKMQEINGVFLNTVANRKEYVVRRHGDRSYWPTKGFDGDVAYMNMIRLTVAPKDYPAFIGLFNEGTKLAKDGNSPLPFAFFTYEIGGSMTDFAIVEYALSAADYATRKAEDEKIFGTEAGQAWYKKMEAMVTGFEETKLVLAPQISRMAKR